MKRLMRAALVGLIGAAAASEALAQGRGRAPIRFSEMDTNNDRVIARKEWRGSDRSFEVHDWNSDGVLSGDEVRTGAARRRSGEPVPFESAEREYSVTDWTARGFTELDHDRDGRIVRDEWHFDAESFRRADHNRDGALSRAEFLGEGDEDDDRDDRFVDIDANNDGRVSRAEWHGTAERFDALDDNRDGMLTRVESRGGADPPPDLFTSVDVNRDERVTRNEWHWTRQSFDGRDRNRDGALTREEFGGGDAVTTRSNAWQRGHERGVAEGRQAGREDKANNAGWDLEGQRELETADAGYTAAVGPKADYQAGYRQGFRTAYREGFASR